MKSALILVSLATLVFAGIAAGLFFSRPVDYTDKVAALEVRLKETEAELAKWKAEAQKPKPPAVAAQSSKPASGPVGDSQTSGEEKSGAATKSGAQDFAKLMNDPKMRDMIKAQQVMQLDMQYGKLYNRLQLDETETAHFKKLLSDRLTAKTDLGMKFMDSNLNKEQRKAMSAAYDTQKKASDDAIRTFLNDENDYKTFQHWEDTEPERMQMTMGRSAFDNVGASLSSDQEEQLITLMADVRKRDKTMPDWNNPRSIDPNVLSDDAFMDRMIKKVDSDALSLQQAAAAFLSPEQLGALKKYQEQMKSMAEMGMKMSRSMFGKK
jgi:hypothetical protein